MSRNKMSGAWTFSHTKTAPAFHRENRGGLIQRFDIRREKKGSSFELLLQFLYGSLRRTYLVYITMYILN